MVGLKGWLIALAVSLILTPVLAVLGTTIMVCFACMFTGYPVMGLFLVAWMGIMTATTRQILDDMLKEGK